MVRKKTHPTHFNDLLMTPEEHQEKFLTEYQAGKNALERGEYRQSILHLEAASQLVTRGSRLGGEVFLWLVSAYQAAGKVDEAIALCQQLANHPYYETRKQSQDLLFIIKAPKLNRPPEWMSQIPDLSAVDQSDPEFRRGKGTTLYKKSQQTEPDLDLTKVNTKDNQFIGVALSVILLTLLSLFIFQ